MKKLLLLIVPVVLLFGVGLAQNYSDVIFTGTYTSQNHVNTNTKQGMWFRTLGTTTYIDDFTLYGPWDYNSQVDSSRYCDTWGLMSGTTLLATGSIISGQYYYDINDVILPEGYNYSVSVYSTIAGKTCKTPRYVTTAVGLFSAFVFVTRHGYVRGEINNNVYTDGNYISAVNFIGFYSPVLGVTVHYNNGTIGYTGTDLYIDQPVKETYMSGGFLHFIIQRFRTLFRM